METYVALENAGGKSYQRLAQSIETKDAPGEAILDEAR